MKHYFLFICLLFFALNSFGQEIKSEQQRPKVGLVLSGGGAKGLAHIGVLKVIDSLGIKIDYIGGTSMGSIIGGLYASGYTGKQLDSIFSRVDTQALIQDFTPRDSKNFYEKRNDEVYALTLPFDNFKVGLPSAFSKGLYNFNLLSKLTLPVRNIKDFNQLPIPFFCVATNMETGKEVILDKGNLAQSQIASSAIPSVFNPVEIDGKMLIDGGVVNNYPVEHLRKLGAEIIIGVDVQDSLKNRIQLRGASELLVQVSNFSMIEKMEAKRKQTDIYIKPNIQGFTVVSFEEGRKIIPKGTEAALHKLEDLKKLMYLKGRLPIPLNNIDSIYIKEVTISPLKNYTRAYVLGQLKLKQNTKVSITNFIKGVNNLNASQNFSTIAYSFEEVEPGKERLVLDLKERESNMFLRFGLHYDDLFKSGVLVNFTKKRFLTNNDVLSADLILGDNIRYNLNYYIDNGFYWSFGINSKYTAFNRNVPNDFNNGQILRDFGLQSINIDYSDFTNQAYFQTIFVQKFSIGAGAEVKHIKLKSTTIQNIEPLIENSTYGNLFAYLRYDSFDKRYFPKKGWYLNTEAKTFLFASGLNDDFERFTYLKGDFGVAQTFFKRFTAKVETGCGFKIGENTPEVFDFVLGGYGFASFNNFIGFYGYDYISLIADSYIKASFTLDVEFYKRHHLNFSGNYANVDDNLFENTENWLAKPSYSGYAVGYGLESVIGPIEIKQSWSPETHDSYTWFSIGYRF